ncbi:hypothetical protein BD309DRAFT_751406 [Dichomitus squalens]|nr:hypothetical protein BD309DRAFT_751406 [Dichomitus squalens]
MQSVPTLCRRRYEAWCPGGEGGEGGTPSRYTARRAWASRFVSRRWGWDLPLSGHDCEATDLGRQCAYGRALSPSSERSSTSKVTVMGVHAVFSATLPVLARGRLASRVARSACCVARSPSRLAIDDASKMCASWTLLARLAFSLSTPPFLLSTAVPSVS